MTTSASPFYSYRGREHNTFYRMPEEGTNVRCSIFGSVLSIRKFRMFGGRSNLSVPFDLSEFMVVFAPESQLYIILFRGCDDTCFYSGRGGSVIILSLWS